ncbi:MAG: Nif3-like dinuclear metal center hexameric protein [Alphaproteobacteria bacterium]
MQATVGDLVRAMEAIAPLRHAASWDNVGLLLGDAGAPLSSVLLAIDLTAAVADEARDRGASAVVANHPPIFRPRKSLTSADPAGRALLSLARAGIAVHSPHTALDAAPGGLADWLVGGLGAGQASPIEPVADLPAEEAVKIVTMVPEDSVVALREAMARAGAGRIGEYDLCSFELRGEGTFRGSDASSPAVGRRGVFECVPEVRLEMVCGRASLAAALSALRGAHPYEEPPIEVHGLEPRPRADAGAGRLLRLDAPVRLGELVERAKRRLGVEHLLVAAPRGLDAEVRAVGACPGAGGELFGAASAQGADAYLTGEMRHHDVLAASEAGRAVLLAGHVNTERPFLPELAARLRAALDGVSVAVSEADRWPLRIA